MPNIGDLSKSKYLTKNDVGNYLRVTIAGYDQINFAKQGQKADMGWILTFQETEKPLRLNKTNGNIIASILGSEEFDDWIGKQITLIWDPKVEFGGECVGGIRVYVKPAVKEDIPF